MLVVLEQPAHVNAVGVFEQVAVRVIVEPSAGEPLLAEIVHTGEPSGAGGMVEPPAGVQNATGCVGLPSPSAL